MADAISPEKRRMIDTAVRAGKVQKCPKFERAFLTTGIQEKPRPNSHRGKQKDPAVTARRQRVSDLIDQGKTASEIAKIEGVTINVVYLDAKILGKKAARAKKKLGTLDAKKRDRTERHSKQARDRRRFKTVSIPFGEPSVVVPAETEGTIFPDRVFEPDGEELVLKDGCNNSKIGGDVLVGWLKGAYIATLTLEERATCPKSCQMWSACYGNSMHHARRWHPGSKLEAQIREEVAIACAKNENVLIRLHILGDFYSADYLQLWADLLDEHDNLHVFGFTAWTPETKIGKGVAWLREKAPRRFMVRTSGVTGKWGSFTLPFPTDRKTIGDAIVCPEQLDAINGCKEARHCGNCGACWSTDRPIAFIEH